MKVSDITVNVYTSYYAKILERHKDKNDFYIQVSNTAFAFKKSVDGLPLTKIIDLSVGEHLGNNTSNLEEYDYYIRTWCYKHIKNLAKLFDKKNILKNNGIRFNVFGKIKPDDEEKLNQLGTTFNFYLLCFENLKAKYSKQDELKSNGLMKAGEFKKCHRQIIAKYITKWFGIPVTELE